MSTPFAASNARHAAKMQPAAATSATATPALHPFEAACRNTLRAGRRAAIHAQTWTGPITEAIPRPCWLVEQAHSENQQRCYDLLRDIGRGMYNRPAVGGQSRIVGYPNVGKETDWTVRVSYKALAYLYEARYGVKVSRATVQGWIRQLAAKRSIILLEVRRPGQAENSREPSAIRIPAWRDVLEARRSDPAIATTHDGTLNWHNGRTNSRRLLAPHQVERWGVERLVAKRDAPIGAGATDAQTAHAAPPDAAAELEKAANLPAVSVGPARPPRRSASPKVVVPPEVQKGLDELCYGVYCDLAPQIVANLRAAAARHSKTFPDEGVVECCTWFLERAGRQTVAGGWRYKVDSVPAFLRHVTTDDHDTDGGANWQTVMRYVDLCEKRRVKALREAREKTFHWLDLLAKHPQDADVLALLDGAASAFQAEYSGWCDEWARAKAKAERAP